MSATPGDESRACLAADAGASCCAALDAGDVCNRRRLRGQSGAWLRGSRLVGIAILLCCWGARDLAMAAAADEAPSTLRGDARTQPLPGAAPSDGGLAAAPASGGPATDDCTALVEQARERGAALVDDLLRECDANLKAVEADLAACDRGEPDVTAERISADIRKLHRLALGPDAGSNALDPFTALADIEAAFSELPPADTDDLAEAEAQLRAVEAENARLAAEVAALEETAGAPGVRFESEQIQALAGALLAPEKCDRIDITVAADGAVSITGSASAQRVEQLRERFAPLAAALPGSRFSVDTAPGGGCGIAIGDAWSLVPDSAGEVRMLGYQEGIAELFDALPQREECAALSAAAGASEALSAWFERGQNPLVWCREGDAVGTCVRDGYANDWSFNPGSGASYSAFAVLPVR